jgi:hypothetical protein
VAEAPQTQLSQGKAEKGKGERVMGQVIDASRLFEERHVRNQLPFQLGLMAGEAAITWIGIMGSIYRACASIILFGAISFW